MAKQKTYKVWKRGERFSTEVEFVISDHPSKLRALLAFAAGRGLKTIDCDAIWVRT